MYKEHVPEYCNVKDSGVVCKQEASHWVGVEPDTFYICSDHIATMTNDNFEVPLVDTSSHEVDYLEVAGYSCDAKCDVCNDIT